MDSWTFGWEALVAIGTLALAGGTVWLALSTRSAARAARDAAHQAAVATQLPAAIELLREYRGRDLREARHRIRELPACDPKQGLSQLTAAQREDVEHVTHFLDNVGLLVERGLLDPEPAAMFLGGSTMTMWRLLGPFIYAERNRPGRATYQRNFEHIAAVFSGMPFETQIGRLKKLPPPATDDGADDDAPHVY